MPGASVGGIGSGPTPWWQLPEYRGSRQNLEQQAPAGYGYDPVKMGYVKTPTQAGSEVNQFNQAAFPALQGLMGSLSGGATGSTGTSGGAGFSASGSTSGGGAPGGGSVSAGSQIPQVSLPNQQHAAEAAFATSKDQAGKLARSGLDSLRGELGSTGNLGGGAEVQGVRDIIQSGEGLMGQASRDQAMKEADLAADFAKTGYLGGITQRGQDVSASEANARLAQERELAASRQSFEQRQLDQQRQLSLMNMALGGLKSSGGGLGYTGVAY